MRRYAETFFRYWLLVLLPIIVLPAAEFALMRHVPKTVLVTADLWVTQNPAGYANPWASAAGNEASYINEYLQSSTDIGPILAGSAAFQQLLRTAPAQALQVQGSLLQGFAVYPKGQYLLNVSFTGQNEAIATDALNGLIAAVQNQQKTENANQTQTNLVVAQAQLKNDTKQLDQSKKALRDYMDRHGLQQSDLSSGAALDLDTTFAGLKQQFQNDQTQYLNDQLALNKLRAQATQATLTLPTTAQAGATFYVKDPATAIVTSSRKKILTAVGEALAVALFLSLGFVVVKTLLNRGLRYPDEVAEVLDLPLLAVVPFSPPPRTRGRGPAVVAGRTAPQGQLADA